MEGIMVLTYSSDHKSRLDAWAGWVLRAGALGRPRGMGRRGRREWGSGWGTHVNPWLIHVNVRQKPLQYCKVINLHRIKINGKIYFKKSSSNLPHHCASTAALKLLSLFTLVIVTVHKDAFSLLLSSMFPKDQDLSDSPFHPLQCWPLIEGTGCIKQLQQVPDAVIHLYLKPRPFWFPQ